MCFFYYICIDPPSKLPNGLHFEWTMKALAAGKHVLVEKPSANTAEETRQMFELAERKGLVLLEAAHHLCVLSKYNSPFC
jgi:predicted dehydrogenase